jgi:rfaE bifunctional protein kinase chain/domain
MPNTLPNPKAAVDETMVAAAQAVRERAGNEKIIFVSGNFNILHPGHLRLFRFAAELGGRLVVGVNADGNAGVTVDQSLRLEDVRAIGAVHEAIALTEEPEAFITRLRPEYVVKGKEYQGLQNLEQAIVYAYGGTLLFSSGEVRFYSSELLVSDHGSAAKSTIIKPTDFPRRNGFTIEGLAKTIEAFKQLKVVVIGDLIVDEYINCDPLGMSREDPTLVVTPVESKRYVGGAGIVAAHALGLGASVTFISVAGDDDAAQFARTELAKQRMNVQIFTDATRPTTLKQRFRASGKTLLRVNHLRQLSVSPDLQGQLMKAAEAALQDADVLLFADFNYGCLAQPVVDHVSAFGQERGVLMAADSQASSQMSDISRFKGMCLITPTEHEVRLALREEEAGLIIIAERLQRTADVENLVITLAGEGLLIYAPKAGAYYTDRLPAFNTAPKDVAGAGDSFFTCAAMALRSGADIWQASYLGSIAAAWQVSHVGNTPLTAAELLGEVTVPIVKMHEFSS